VTAPPEGAVSRPARSLRAAWAYFGAYLLWAGAMLAGLVERGVANDLLFLPLYLGAGLAGLHAARVHAGSPRIARGWRLVASAWLTSCAAAALMTAAWVWPASWLETVSLGIYQLYFPLLLVGFWHLIELPAGTLARIRLAVEGLIVVVATVILAWYWIFRFDEAARSLLPYLKVVLVMFPGELAVALGAVVIVHRPAHAGAPRTLSLLSVGTLAAVVADFIYEYDQLIGSGWSGAGGDALLGFAAALVITAGLSTRRGAERREDPAVSIGLALVPYLAIGVVGALVICQWWRPDPLHPALPGLVLGGAVLMGLLIARLIVAQREFEAEAYARAVQDARFRSLVQRSSDAVLVVDRGSRILYASPPFGAMLGAPGEAQTGRRLADLIAFDPPGGLEAWLAQPSKRPLARWKAGEGRDIEALATDHHDDPSIGGIVINARDVTERTRLEARLQQAQKLEAVGRFASSVAHDFNNVLTVISGNLHFLRSGGLGQASEELAQVEAAADRGAALARQLTALSRPKPVTTSTVDLTASVRAIERPLRVLLPSSIRTTVSVPADTLVVRLDEVQVEQVLLNLALNSRDAMPEGGTLEVRLDTTDQPGDAGPSHHAPWARIVVRDSGSGMSAAVMVNAFEPFFTTKDATRGSGLGLSSVRAIVTEAGGRVDLDSQPGAGATVTILLPLSSAPAPGASARDVPAEPKGKGHLLVVDDEVAVRRVVARYLAEVGYQAAEAEDGTAALDYLNTHAASVQLVLTDLVMPRMSGQELASHVTDRWPHIRVLFMSGTPGVLAGRREPWATTEVIAKPTELSAVAARIAEALRVEHAVPGPDGGRGEEVTVIEDAG
jgi:PAS domain S-box-containing protein